MSRPILLLSTLITCLIVPASASSVTEISWHTIDSGGGSSLDMTAGLRLNGTLGQWDAGTMSSARFELQGGFWTGGDQDRVFRDRFES